MIRKIMDDNDWKSQWQTDENKADGMLLFHVRKYHTLFIPCILIKALSLLTDKGLKPQNLIRAIFVISFLM